MKEYERIRRLFWPSWRGVNSDQPHRWPGRSWCASWRRRWRRSRWRRCWSWGGSRPRSPAAAGRSRLSEPRSRFLERRRRKSSKMERSLMLHYTLDGIKKDNNTEMNHRGFLVWEQGVQRENIWHFWETFGENHPFAFSKLRCLELVYVSANYICQSNAEPQPAGYLGSAQRQEGGGSGSRGSAQRKLTSPSSPSHQLHWWNIEAVFV